MLYAGGCCVYTTVGCEGPACGGLEKKEKKKYYYWNMYSLSANVVMKPPKKAITQIDDGDGDNNCDNTCNNDNNNSNNHYDNNNNNNNNNNDNSNKYICNNNSVTIK